MPEYWCSAASVLDCDMSRDLMSSSGYVTTVAPSFARAPMRKICRTVRRTSTVGQPQLPAQHADASSRVCYHAVLL